MESIRISVRLDADTKRRLREEARAAGKHESEVVREVLAAYFAEQKREASALDRAQRAGIVGCAKGLPPDLSTNKDHFEGFGR
ncbi:MAG: ribbon-helix-helix domain-containing protein [Gemmataceae bacterium]|nr:ribbon-helix-helix domain-containing protein [Gemmataceae bacterium]